jgi:hypothetical protein
VSLHRPARTGGACCIGTFLSKGRIISKFSAVSSLVTLFGGTRSVEILPLIFWEENAHKKGHG